MVHLMLRSLIPRPVCHGAGAIVRFAFCLVIVIVWTSFRGSFGASEAQAQGLPNPKQAKAANLCQVGVNKAAGKFFSATLKGLSNCSGGLGKCLQTLAQGSKRDDCLAKAREKCDAGMSQRLPDQQSLSNAIATKCADSQDLLVPQGLGFAALNCTEFGLVVGARERAVECVAAHHLCRVEAALELLAPRTREMMRAVGANEEPLSCVPDYGGNGVGLADLRLGGALNKCSVQIRKAGLGFLQQSVKALQTCIDGAFACVQTKPNDRNCLVKANAKCAGKLAKLPPAETKLRSAIDKKCAQGLVSFETLMEPEGSNLAALAPRCGTLGSLADYETCLLEELGGSALQLVQFEAPRSDELFARLACDPSQRVCNPVPLFPSPTPTPVNCTVGIPGTAKFETANFSLDQFSLMKAQRTSATECQLTYAATLVNTSGMSFDTVKATLSLPIPGINGLSDQLNFANVATGGSVVSTGGFSVVVTDPGPQLDTSSLVWDFEASDVMTLAATTRVIDGTHVQVIGGDDTSLTLVIDATVPPLAVGELLVGSAGDGIPILRRITAVGSATGQVVVSTVPGSLDEAIASGSTLLDRKLRVPPQQQSGAQRDARINSSSDFTFKVSVTQPIPVPAPASLEASLDAEVNTRLVFAFRKPGGIFQGFRIAYDGNLKAALGAKAKVEVELPGGLFGGTVPDPPVRIPLGTVPLPGLPIVVSPVAELSTTADLNLALGTIGGFLASSVAINPSLDCAPAPSGSGEFSCTASGDLGTTFEPSFDPESRFEGVATLRDQLNLELTLFLDGIFGPKMTLEPFAADTFHVRAADRCALVDVSAGVGSKWGYALGLIAHPFFKKLYDGPSVEVALGTFGPFFCEPTPTPSSTVTPTKTPTASPATPTATPTPGSLCGNGALNSQLEECDDGNVENGDGCSTSCTIEPGWKCDILSQPSACMQMCGGEISTVIAQTGEQGITNLGAGVTVNSEGQVAFVGTLAGGSAIFAGDGSSAPRNVTPNFVDNARSFGPAVQLNEQHQVVAWDQYSAAPPFTFIRLWDTTTVNAGTTIARGGGPRLCRFGGGDRQNQPCFNDSDCLCTLPGICTGLTSGKGCRTSEDCCTFVPTPPFRICDACSPCISGRCISPEFDGVMMFPAVNNDGEALFSAFSDTTEWLVSGQSPAFSRLERRLPLHPMVADDGHIVVQAVLGEQSAPNPSVQVCDYELATCETIADSANFAATGNSPGISDDGSVAVFYGDLNAAAADALEVLPGPGIFASVAVADGTRRLIRLTGRQDEDVAAPGGNNDGRCDGGETCVPAPEIGVDLPSFTPIGFRPSGFLADSRIGVVARPLSANLDFSEGGTFDVAFLGTPNRRSGFLDTTVGMFVLRTYVEVQGAQLGVRFDTAVPVTQVGRLAGDGGTITQLGFNDPLAARKQEPDANWVTYWAATDRGQIIERRCIGGSAQ